ncbi:MAG: PKD domain-containing protein [Planctomycetota bacterium]|jgi:hypothetical protein
MRRVMILAALLSSPLAAGGQEPSVVRSRVVAGEVVLLEAPGPAAPGSRWVQLSGPDLLFRGGVVEGRSARFVLRTNGVYRFAFLPEPDAGLMSSHVRVVETERKAMQETVVSGLRRTGAGETVTLLAEPEVRCACKVVDVRRRWKQIGGPRLRFSRAELSGNALSFVPEAPGLYRFIAMTAGSFGKTPWAVHTVEVPARADGRPERRPAAMVAPVASAHVGEEVMLDGSRSRDPDGDELVYRWFQASGPAAQLGGQSPRVRFTSPAKGDYAFTLTVVDPAGLESRPAAVTFVVTRPPGLTRPDSGASVPLDRPFTARLENEPLSKLVTRLSGAGVTVRASARLNAELPFDEVMIDLWVVDMPVRKVLDWVGRALDAFYVIEEPGAVWFARDTRWLEREKPVAETYRIDALWSEPGARGLGGLLAEAVRAATWAGSGMSVGRPDTDAETVTAILPRSAQRRLAGLLAELRREVPSGPPPREEDGALTRAMARPVRAQYEDWPVRDVAWDLARQARLPVGFPPLGAQGGGRISIELGETTLGQALDALVKVGGFAGWRVEPPRAVWCFKGSPPPLTSECTWSAAEIRGYDTRMLENAHGFAGPMIVHLVRSRCLPGRWRDPFSLVGYSRARRRLVVIHTREVQLAVARLLDRLAREGERALEAGEAPVEGAPVGEAPDEKATPRP